jgi:imidazole glycerol-phosphate synthase subunit HisH
MIAIIKYNAGNIRSVLNSVTRLGYDSIITDKKDDLLNADKIILPGVGEAASAMKDLRERGIDKILLSIDKPVLGICLGLQLLCLDSEEGNAKCLGVFNSHVRKFPPEDKVPHTGWDNFKSMDGELLKDLKASDDFYYVHSYYSEICKYTTAVCDYILPFSAVMQKDNYYAVQFHPEKSAERGEKVMKNFLEL